MAYLPWVRQYLATKALAAGLVFVLVIPSPPFLAEDARP